MNSFYTVLYVQTNPFVNERFSIGLLLTDNDKTMFEYSFKKLKHLKHILRDKAYMLIRECIKNIDCLVEENKEQTPPSLFNDTKVNHRMFSSEYLSYLADYSNNLLQFSKPAIFDLPTNKKNFDVLFGKYVFLNESDEKVVEKKVDVKKIVQRDLYPKIRENVNIDFNLKPDHVEHLIFPVKVSFIGLNGIPVTGKAIDFGKRSHDVENDIGRYFTLIKAFELSKQPGKHFLIGDLKAKNRQSLWKNIRKQKIFDIVPFDETELISDYIIKQGVIPFYNPENEEEVIATTS